MPRLPIQTVGRLSSYASGLRLLTGCSFNRSISLWGEGRSFCTKRKSSGDIKGGLTYKAPPEANQPWAPPEDSNKLYSADSIPQSVVDKAKEEDSWLPIRDVNSGGVYWWHPRSNATTPIGSGKPETLMRALGNSAMFGAGAAMFFALLYRVFGM
ncbi:hypothetical protein FOZ60_002759 [Perkinsus olseni]|uniref:Uncharacterized protein n=2 Tax=Perkinsus olseni TaxID=32597 RepID=A0A7J6NX82_PEROL|nr:hypothetical protein FOZ60_002759 [Perkinsus olseni]